MKLITRQVIKGDRDCSVDNGGCGAKICQDINGTPTCFGNSYKLSPDKNMEKIYKRFSRLITETSQISRHKKFAAKMLQKVGDLSDLMVDKYMTYKKKCDFPNFNDENEEDDARFDRENPCKAANQLTSAYIKWASVYNNNCKRPNNAFRRKLERDFGKVQAKIQVKIGSCDKKKSV